MQEMLSSTSDAWSPGANPPGAESSLGADDRRSHPRLGLHELPGLRAARLKHGPSVTLIDLSVGGVLLETDDRLCPGSNLALEIVGSSQIVVPLRVVRSQIASLREGMLYRGACAFGRPLELPDFLLESSTRTTVLRTSRPDPVPTVGPSAGRPPAGWSLVVLRYLDGKPLRGFCKDFNASRTQFHLLPSIETSPTRQMICPMTGLKAVFFVRDFDGDPAHVERQTFDVATHGRRLEVSFLDGEVMVGSTLNYRAQGAGFFLCPADPDSNNIRIFVVRSSVRHVRFM
jgi:hypothetical protein